MAITERYLNPFTDFGFKKPFEAVEIGNFTREELADYENSLKHYRDMKNVLDTAIDEGHAKGRYQNSVEVALRCLQKGLPIDLISDLTGLSKAEIEALQQP